MMENKIAIVSCYFQHNYGSMLQAYATQMALDKLGYENETINIAKFNHEIKKAKMLYFVSKPNIRYSAFQTRNGEECTHQKILKE